ncbi:MAG: Chalcone synthase [Polyangiaceae bacterium]|nr:Chalcone synthase [Polyangiaceae bacterium]
MLLLGDFRSLRPRHRSTQAQTLEWLANAHARAEKLAATLEGRELDEPAFRESMKRRLARFGCGDDKIASRGHELDDCSHLRWEEMEVYTLAKHASGEGMRVRTRAFGRIAQRALAQLFVEVETAPQHLLHVTCTGYEAPSAAQLLVASKDWGQRTSVTHAYHMGCYAALPALRIASGFRTQAGAAAHTPAGQARVDIVHTEICSLHLNPLRHDPEQLVIQSLFADGCIAYSLYADEDARRPGPSLALLAQDEWIVPDSAASMAWFCSDFGMEMSLARDVPEKIAQSLTPFVESLLARAGAPSAMSTALFAIHPGGPKIVDQVGATLGLGEPQIQHSRSVLRERGNMSSATLPHVWKSIAESGHVPGEQLVVSLAFGPGLTLSGAVLRKVAASG